MRQKRFIVIGIFFVASLWLHPIWHGWCQSEPYLAIESESAVLMDGITGQILLKKNPEKRFNPASLVKVMTLYLAFDAVNSSYQVVLPRDAVAGFPDEYVDMVFRHTLGAIATLPATDELIAAWRS